MTTKEAKAAKTSVLSGWFGLVLGVSVTKSTGASAFFKFRPRPLLTGPLYATFVHILRLKALLSIRKFKVITRPAGSIQKAQQIADY
jgi:hypothetical protein